MIPERLSRFAQDFTRLEDRPKVSFWLPGLEFPVFSGPPGSGVLILRHKPKPGAGLFFAGKALMAQASALCGQTGGVYDTTFHAPDEKHPYALLECREVASEQGEAQVRREIEGPGGTRTTFYEKPWRDVKTTCTRCKGEMIVTLLGLRRGAEEAPGERTYFGCCAVEPCSGLGAVPREEVPRSVQLAFGRNSWLVPHEVDRLLARQ